MEHLTDKNYPSHLTIISSSDGYSDVVYLSQVADEISKVPYGTIDCAKKLKANLTRLMQDNIIDKAIWEIIRCLMQS